MKITRRKLAVGATVALLALLGSTLAYVQSSAAAPPRMGGVHIYVIGDVVQPPPPPGTPTLQHTFVMTLWGPDEELTGLGSGYTDRTPEEEPRGATVRSDYILGTGLIGCVFSAIAKVKGDVVKGKAIMIYSGSPDEKMGQPFPFEVNLSTGAFKARDMNMGMGTEITVTGKAVVARIAK